jgi:uncharacterized membrane protein YbhN (UPF0104 family)
VRWPPSTSSGATRREDTDPGSRIDALVGPARIVFVTVILAVAAITLAKTWDDVRATVLLTSPIDLLASGGLVLAGLSLSVLTWRRCLLEMGSRVVLSAASRIYLLGQLGKYLPGSVWALFAQTEIGRAAGVPRARGFAASVVAVAVNTAVGLALGVAILPGASELGVGYTWALVGIAVLCAAALAPPVLTRLVNFGITTINRPPLERPVAWRGIGVASAWSGASYVAYGLSVWVLAVSVGAPAGQSLLLCVAGVPLAMIAGLVVFIAPSGLGVREAALVAALTPVLEPSQGLAVALLARLVFTAADFVAALAVVPLRTRPAEAA